MLGSAPAVSSRRRAPVKKYRGYVRAYCVATQTIVMRRHDEK